MFTIAPERRSRIPGSTCWTQRMAPYRFTFMTWAYSSMGHSSVTALPPMPALFTSTSIRPACSSTLPMPWRTESSSAMSMTTGWTSTPASSAMASSLAAASRLRSVA